MTAFPRPFDQLIKPGRLAVMLLLAGLLAYANSFRVPFLLDDTTAIQENPALRKVWPLWEALSPPTHTGLGGRPIANLAFVLNYAVSGESLVGFHTVNLLLHFLTALTLGGVVRRTLQSPALRARFGDDSALLALVVAGIWLLHPIQTQSVTYISQRTELLLGVFYLFCLYAFIRAVEAERPLGWYSLATLSALAGVASKESMVTVPVMILAYDLLLVNTRHPTEIWSRRRGFYAALASSWLLLALLMRDLPARGVGFGATMSAGTYAVIEGQALFRYALRSVWPHPLIFDHGTDFPAATPFDFLLGGLVLLSALLAVWLVIRGRHRALPAFCFFLVLAPTSSVVPIPLQPISENRAYLASVAIVISLVLGAYAVVGRRGLIAGLALMPALAALTWQRNSDYRTPISIWSDTVRKLPGSSRAHNNLGRAYHEAGHLTEALAEFTRAVALRPDYQMAHENLATVAGLLGRDDLAVQHGRVAVRLDPSRAQAHYNLGVALRNTGDLPGALEAFTAAARLQPDPAIALANLADVELLLGRPADALATSVRAIAADPHLATARNAQAAALYALGRIPEALEVLRATVQAHANDANARLLLGNYLLNTGAPAEATTHLLQLLSLQPENTAALISLAASLVQLGRGTEAIQPASLAAQRLPNDAFTRCVLGLALMQAGRATEAQTAFETALRLDPASALARENLAKLKALPGK